MTDNLQRREWQLAFIYHLYNMVDETCASMLYFRITTNAIFGKLVLQCPSPDPDFPSWWCEACKSVAKKEEKCLTLL